MPKTPVYSLQQIVMTDFHLKAVMLLFQVFVLFSKIIFLTLWGGGKEKGWDTQQNLTQEGSLLRSNPLRLNTVLETKGTPFIGTFYCQIAPSSRTC